MKVNLKFAQLKAPGLNEAEFRLRMEGVIYRIVKAAEHFEEINVTITLTAPEPQEPTNDTRDE